MSLITLDLISLNNRWVSSIKDSNHHSNINHQSLQTIKEYMASTRDLQWQPWFQHCTTLTLKTISAPQRWSQIKHKSSRSVTSNFHRQSWIVCRTWHLQALLRTFPISEGHSRSFKYSRHNRNKILTNLSQESLFRKCSKDLYKILKVSDLNNKDRPLLETSLPRN